MNANLFPPVRRLLPTAGLLLGLILAACTTTSDQLFESIADARLGVGETVPNATVPQLPTPTVSPTPVPLQLGTVLVDRLNLRATASLDGSVIDKLFSNETVTVVDTSEDGEWLQVETDAGDVGWVAVQFLVVEEIVGNAGDEAADISLETEDPETGDSETGDLEIGDVEGLDVAEDDASIAELVLVPTATPAAAATPAPTPTVPTAYTQPDRMNVRRGPGTNYEVVATVEQGTALEILALGPSREWFQIVVEDQEEPAYVFAGLTDTAGPVDVLPVLTTEEIPAPPEPAAVVQASAAPVNAPPPSGAGFFGYGVQAHMLGGGINEAVDATANLGFNWMKQQVEWRVFEGSQGNVDFSELRRIVDTAGSRGISVLFSVVNAPDWAREPGFDPSVGGPPADPGTYAAFVGRLAGEFCGSGLKAIEVWNEQNLHYEWGNKPLNPADYMNLLRPAYASIKAACPSMLVISGALTPAGDAGPYARDDFAYLEGMYQNGLAGYADGIGVHPSGFNVPPSVGWQQACGVIQTTGNTFNGPCDTPHHSWSFRSTMEGYRNIMVVYGDANKRLWPTEFGWAVGPAVNGAYAYANDNSPEEQAAWTVEAFQMMRNWGYVGPAFLWNLNFRVVADGTEKAQWGIVRNDYGPMPVYDALRGMGK